MLYKITKKEASAAKIPHHIFNLNVILTHLAMSKVALEIGDGSPINFIMIPIISIMVISYLYFKSQQKAREDSWFVAAHWTLAWRRGRILIISYVVAITVFAVVTLIGSLLGGGMMMNDFSADGSSTPIHEKITMFLSAVIVFFTLLVMFLQEGISVYDAGKGIIDPAITKYIPRGENANEVLAENEYSTKNDKENQ
ncbi:hypothetical protein MNBD_GAMMA03-1492 [hydrothermal vent metagenome]|uniref:Uncharacterized protein n=1 Tax=hydrothermal vent metagenome TaxID=652676 RepID=A0A3B0VY09_9ZZZZ